MAVLRRLDAEMRRVIEAPACAAAHESVCEIYRSATGLDTIF